ncbi:pyocin activator PrtN family protein [Psychrobacter cibarius]|nr:pyocin activator PrtN family protein [Psychrobacter cibarius]
MTNFNTEQMLIMRYGFNPLIPLDLVAKDYLRDTTIKQYEKQARDSNLPFPVVINGKGKATTYHVHVKALVQWIDNAAEVAAKDHHAMNA